MSDTNDPGKPTPPEAPVPPVPPTPPAPPTQPEPPRFDEADAQPTTATPQAGGDQQPTTALPQTGGDQQPTSVLPGFDGSPYDGGQQNTFQQNADQQPTTALPQSQAPQFNAAPPAPPVPPQQAPGQGYPAYSAAPREPKGLAITAMILGIVAVVGALIFGWLPFVGGIITILVGAAAVVLGIIALRKKQSKGMSLTGLITGGVGVLIGIGIVITWAAVFSSVGSELDSYSDSLDELQSEIESPSSDSSDSDALTEDLEASAEPTTPGTEEAPADTTGDRSPEFCAALDDAVAAWDAAEAGALTPDQLAAFERIAGTESPNQAQYERFLEVAANPGAITSTEEAQLQAEFIAVIAEDSMACM